MKHTLNTGKVSLLALILAGGFSVASFECVYGAKEGSEKEKVIKLSSSKADDRVQKAQKEADQKAKSDHFSVGSEASPAKDIKLTVSAEKDGSITRVQDETGKDVLRVDDKEKKIIGSGLFLPWFFMSAGSLQNVNKVKLKVFDASKRLDLNVDSLDAFDVVFSSAKKGNIPFEMTQLSQQDLDHVKAFLHDPEFLKKHKTFLVDYAHVNEIRPYVGVSDKLKIILSKKESGAYVTSSGLTVLKENDGSISYFDPKKRVSGVKFSNFDVILSVGKKSSSMALDIPLGDVKARKLLEHKYGVPVVTKGRALYLFTQNQRREMKKWSFVEKKALGNSNLIFKMKTPGDVEATERALAKKLGLNSGKKASLLDSKEIREQYGDLAQLSRRLRTPGKKGWGKDDALYAYIDFRGKGLLFYDPEKGRLAVFNLELARSALDRIEPNSPLDKYRIGFIIDLRKFPGFTKRYLEDVDYFRTLEGRAVFSNLKSWETRRILEDLSFYEGKDSYKDRKMDLNPGFALSIEGVNANMNPGSFEGNSDEFVDGLFKG